MRKEHHLNESGNRIEELLAEVWGREHTIDTLPNASFDFAAERQAIYFSNARKNMRSEMAHATMECGQSAEDLKVLGRYESQQRLEGAGKL